MTRSIIGSEISVEHTRSGGYGTDRRGSRQVESSDRASLANVIAERGGSELHVVHAWELQDDDVARVFDGYSCPKCCAGRLRVIGLLAPLRFEGG